MRTRAVLVAAIVALMALAACGDDSKNDNATNDASKTVQTTAAGGEQVTLKADLAGGTTEVPKPGDPDGKGAATVKIDTGKGEVCYTITVENIATPVASHIHKAPAGGAGDIVITFDPAKIGQGEDCLQSQKKADLDAIVADPSGYYVNVHTGDFPTGAVRGQLAKG